MEGLIVRVELRCINARYWRLAGREGTFLL